MLVPDVDEVDPFGVIREKRIVVQIIAENIFKKRAGFSVRHFLETCARPSLRVAFDDESARCLVKFIRVRGEDARIGFAEGERQAVKELMRSVPDIFIRAYAQLRLEEFVVALSDCAIDSIRADEQVAVCGVRAGVRDLRAKIQINAKMLATALQNLQELDARDAGKAVAANRNFTPAM